MGCVVIEQENHLCALVHYIFHQSTWTAGAYCYLQDLFADPVYRSQGFAKQLIDAVYAEAKKRGCSRVYSLTHQDNRPARALYDQVAEYVGFIQYRQNIDT